MSKQLIFQGPICETGYGMVATNQLYELDKLGQDIVLVPKNREVSASTKYHEVIRRTAGKILELKQDSPFLKIWHQFELLERIGRGKYIGYPIFEMDRQTPFEQLHLRACDQILVCSKWAQKVLSQHNIESDVVPLGVDLDIFRPKPYKAPKKNLIFTNFGKWEIRKGHDILLSAFNKAFSPKDDVELWACCQNFLLGEAENKEWNDSYMNTPMGKAGRIKLIPRQENHDQIASIMGMVDCGVFPARAEGWNLEVLELMACGVPSIVTDYAGHTEFCNEYNSFLLAVNSMETAFDGKWFKPGLNANQGEWASIDEDILVELLRNIYHNREQLETKKAVALHTAVNFSWRNCAKRLLDVTGL